MGREPVALYMTPDGKHAIAGTLFDSDGKNVTAGTLGKLAGKPMTDVVFGQLSKSLWIPDGRDAASRTVYVLPIPTARIATSSGPKPGRGSMPARCSCAV